MIRELPAWQLCPLPKARLWSPGARGSCRYRAQRPIEVVLLRLDQVNGAALLGANMGDTVAHRAAANDGYNLDAIVYNVVLEFSST